MLNILYKYALSVSPCANARVVAAVCHRKDIIAFGHNRYKTHPLQAKYSRNPDSIFLHAEIDAIARAVKEGVQMSSIYILRVKRSSPKGSYILGMAKPCCGCMRAIVAFGINNVCFSTNHQTMESL